MQLGERILNLRKRNHLSQEELAYKLGVTRQTISKWETDQSMPDLDKVIPICDLFHISIDEFLTGKNNLVEEHDVPSHLTKRAIITCISGFLYLLSLIWMILGSSTFNVNYGILISVFLFMCGLATILLIYNATIYVSKTLEEPTKKENLFQTITYLTALGFIILYLFISFMSKAWDVTWILFIIYTLVREIIRLIFSVRREKK